MHFKIGGRSEPASSSSFIAETVSLLPQLYKFKYKSTYNIGVRFLEFPVALTIF